MLLLAPFGRSAAKITDLKEAKVELKSSSSTKQFQILLVLMRKDFWYVLVLHFLIMYLLTLLVEDLVRLPYLRTPGRTEGFTLTRPCIKIEKKKRLDLKVHASNKYLLGLEFVNETYNLLEE